MVRTTSSPSVTAPSSMLNGDNLPDGTILENCTTSDVILRQRAPDVRVQRSVAVVSQHKHVARGHHHGPELVVGLAVDEIFGDLLVVDVELALVSEDLIAL